MYLEQDCLTFFGKGPRLLLCSDSLNAVLNSTVSLTINLPDITGPRCPEGSRKLRFLDYVTVAQDGGKDSALLTGRFYP